MRTTLPDWEPEPPTRCEGCGEMHSAEFPCAAECESAWDPDDVVDLGPGPGASADGWYLDLVARAMFPGSSPHDDWRN